jgi:hypothetical protein
MICPALEWPEMSTEGRVGRNAPCPCQSGKKYKHCCLGKSEFIFRRSPQYFTMKGQQGERLVQDLAEKTFLADWCYSNPKLPDGKELCDLLVVFDTTAIIWQIKNLDVDKDGLFHDADLEKNLRQLSGARRQLFDLRTKVELTNPRRGKEVLDTTNIKDVHLISVILDPPEGVAPHPALFLERIKTHTAHVFHSNFTELVLKELDTVRDFCEFLTALESIAAETKIVLAGGEEELLAHYLTNDRSFRFLNREKVNLVHEGAWHHLQNDQNYVHRKHEDEVSYFWDHLIDMAHEGSEEEPQYERVARELARWSRFDRRVLAKLFIEAHERAHEERSKNVYRRVFDFGGLTLCFLFMHNPVTRQVRKLLLRRVAFVARGKFLSNPKVIGIATEMKLNAGHTFDFGLLEKDDWTPDDQRHMEDIQAKFGILTAPSIRGFDEEGYKTGLRFYRQEK